MIPAKYMHGSLLREVPVCGASLKNRDWERDKLRVVMCTRGDARGRILQTKEAKIRVYKCSGWVCKPYSTKHSEVRVSDGH